MIEGNVEKMRTYENSPDQLVLLLTIITLSIYVIGAFILSGFGFIAILLFSYFSLLILFLIACMVILSFADNAWIRGSFVCKYCKQQEIGYPAQKLFASNAENF